jgi:DnaJ-class molecular chaperone
MKRRQRELALKWHPDRWSSGTAEERALAESRMKEINAAFGTLEEAAAVAAAASV